MATDQQLNDLIKSINELTRVMNAGGMGGASYQPRIGRGGNSNGVSANAPSSRELKKSYDDLERFIRLQGNSAQQWRRALIESSEYVSVFGHHVDTVTNAIERMAEQSNDATRKVTKATVKFVREYGAASLEVKNLAINSAKMSDELNRFNNATQRKIASETDLIEVNKMIVDEEAKVAGKRGKQKKAILEVIAVLKEQKKAIEKTITDSNTIMQDSMKEFDALRKTLDETSPLFEGLNQSTKDVIKTQDLSTVSADKLQNAFNELQQATGAQSRAFDVLNAEHKAHLEALHAARANLLSTLKVGAKAADNILGKVAGDIRSRIANNVMESNYGAAISMGMAESDLSKFLGENADLLRSMNGNGDNTAVLDGRLQAMQKHTTALFGVSGEAALKTIADAGEILQNTGINLKNSPNAINNQLSQVSAMADRLGMVKGDLLQFQKELSASGDMAYLTSKYQALGQENAQTAMNKELEARIANAKMLGLSTEHVKKQIQMERANRFGTMEQQMNSLLSGRMDAKIASKQGVQVTPELQKLIDRRATGDETLTADDYRILQLYDMDAKAAHANSTKAAFASGSLGEVFKNGVYRSISSRFGSEQYTADGMNEYYKQEAAMSKYSEEEKAKFRANGTYSEIARKAVSDADNPGAFGPFSQMLNRGATISEGVKSNTLVQIAGDVKTMVGQLDKIFYAIVGQTITGFFGGGGGGRRLLRKAAGSRAGQAASSAVGRVMGSSTMGTLVNGGGKVLTPLMKKLPIIGALWSGYDGYTESKSKNESTGKALSTGFGGALGGAGGAWAGAAAGGAAGALIGSVVPVIGTAIGGAAGTLIGGIGGALAGDELGKWAGSTLYDQFTKSSDDAEKERKANAKPQEVVITGAGADAMMQTAANTAAVATSSEAQAAEAKKANEYTKSKSEIRDMLKAKSDSINATVLKYQDTGYA